MVKETLEFTSREEGKDILPAVDVLIIRDGKVLLGLRKALAGKSTWGLPGGHQRTGEKMIDTARRELREELGDDVAISVSERVVAVRENIIPPWYVQHNTIILQGEYLSGEIINPDLEENAEWKWFPTDKLPENMFSGVKEIIDNYKVNVVGIVTDWNK